MSRLVDWCGTIAQSVIQIPVNIFDLFKDILSNIGETLTNLPAAILDGLKKIFIPDTEEIEKNFHTAMDTFQKKFNVSPLDLSSILLKKGKSGEVDLPEISGDLSLVGVGTVYTGSWIDWSYLVAAVAKVRPMIRGLFVLTLLIYNFNQFCKFIKVGDITDATEHTGLKEA